MKKAKRTKKAPVWRPFLKFYTRFPIPWWLYGLSLVFSIAYTELGVHAAKYTILFNTGELYNSTLIGYAAVTLLMSVVSIAMNMFSQYGDAITTLRVRGIIWKKILRLPMCEVEKELPSALISRVTADASQACLSIAYMASFISSVYGFGRMFYILYSYNATLTMWLLLVIPVAVLVFWLVGLAQFISQKKIYGAINTMTCFFSEHLAAAKHMKAQATEEQERQAGFAAIEQRFRSDVFLAFTSALQVSLNSIYSKISMLVLVFAGRREILAGRMEQTGLTTADTYLGNVQKSLAEILTQYSSIKGIQGILYKVSQLMDAPEESSKAQYDMESREEDIIFENVTFGYDPAHPVLRNLSLTIPAGKKTAIVGANGSGKSTLMKLMLRFYEPTSGSIRYGRQKAGEIHLDSWRQSFGYVLQNSPLFSGTIRENLVYGLDREVTQAELDNAARIADAYDFIMEFPEGFDKQVGEGGMYLSGGQRQRIAIARAVMIDPGLLMMDEATASLDHQSDRAVWDATEKLMQGRTTVLIAHDMKAVETADNIIVLNSGRLEAVGSSESLMATSPTYREFVALQTAKEAV